MPSRRTLIADGAAIVAGAAALGALRWRFTAADAVLRVAPVLA